MKKQSKKRIKKEDESDLPHLQKIKRRKLTDTAECQIVEQEADPVRQDVRVGTVQQQSKPQHGGSVDDEEQDDHPDQPHTIPVGQGEYNRVILKTCLPGMPDQMARVGVGMSVQVSRAAWLEEGVRGMPW